MASGTITKITEKGFGFISPSVAGGKDIFFHATALVDKQYDDLQVGDAVEYDIDDRGDRVRAANVRVT